MQIAEKTRCTPIMTDIGQHGRVRRLGQSTDECSRLTDFVQQAKIFSVEMKIAGVLARENGIGLRACRNQDRMRGQEGLSGLVPHAVAIVVLHRDIQSRGSAVGIDFDGKRRQPFGKMNPLFQRLSRFLRDSAYTTDCRSVVDDRPPSLRPTLGRVPWYAPRDLRVARRRVPRVSHAHAREIPVQRLDPAASNRHQPRQYSCQLPTFRIATGISRPGPDSRQATRWRYRSRSIRRRRRRPVTGPACSRSNPSLLHR